ncbi:hypothetical protein ACGFXB_10235, partial [Streptomyces canus]|uniref:hypothetical protein n=1 Tax=Streptomyces canus TaxID=58343 RepID=UPI00371053BB
MFDTAWPAVAGDAGTRLPSRRVRAMRPAHSSQPLPGDPDAVTVRPSGRLAGQTSSSVRARDAAPTATASRPSSEGT